MVQVRDSDVLLRALGHSQRLLHSRHPILSSKVGLEIHCYYMINTREQILLLAASVKLRGEPGPSPRSRMQRDVLLGEAREGRSLGWCRTCCYMGRERHCAFQ